MISLARGKRNRKHNHTIEFENDMTLDNEEKYELRAVCNHLSTVTKFGHYTASVKMLGTQTWYQCDDSHCSKSGYSCSNAAMMIYVKK